MSYRTRSGYDVRDLLESRALMRLVLARHAARRGRRFEVVS